MKNKKTPLAPATGSARVASQAEAGPERSSASFRANVPAIELSLVIDDMVAAARRKKDAERKRGYQCMEAFHAGKEAALIELRKRVFSKQHEQARTRNIDEFSDRAR